MLRKCLAIVLAVAVCHLINAAPASAAAKAERGARRASEVRAKILKLGAGESARVKIKLRDGTKLAGHIGEAGADSFTVVDLKTGAATSVPYPSVKQAQGHNLSTGTKIAIGLGVAAVILLIIIATTDVGPDFT